MTAQAQILHELVPNQRNAVMDLVEDAGVDTAGWSVKEGNKPVKNPRANPKYCYQWAFGGDNEPTVLCVWHRDLVADHDEITLRDNLRDYAIRLESVRNDRFVQREVRHRAVEQASRAREFDSLLQRAFRKSQSIRVILLKGTNHDGAQLGSASSTVEFRTLDHEPWHVRTYGDDGEFVLVRGIERLPKSGQESASPAYVDQFSNPPPPERVSTTASSFTRSAAARLAALKRAAGRCELCGAPGFRAVGGSIYLETHHVIALSEGGADLEWNIVAICPNDHREAHHGTRRELIRIELISLLVERYPPAKAALQGAVTSVGEVAVAF